MVIKRFRELHKSSWRRVHRWLVVNIKIHLCSSGVNSDHRKCFFCQFLGSVQAGDRTNWPLTPRDVYFFWKCMRNSGSLSRTFCESSFDAIQDGDFVCQPKEACGAPLWLATLVFLSPQTWWKGRESLPLPFRSRLPNLHHLGQEVLFLVSDAFYVFFEMSSLHLFWCFFVN